MVMCRFSSASWAAVSWYFPHLMVAAVRLPLVLFLIVIARKCGDKEARGAKE